MKIAFIFSFGILMPFTLLTSASAHSEAATSSALAQPFSQLKVTPASLSFPKLNLTKGPFTAQKSFTMKNTGTADLSVTVGSPATSDFIIVAGAGQTTLGAMQSQTVTIQFAPTQDGNFSDSILITSNATKGSTNATVKVKGSAQKQFTALSATMTSDRNGHTATRLQNGLVLLAGGQNSSHGDGLDTTELYDPIAQTFTPIIATMTTLRGEHTATLLQDGKVLLTGGYNGGTTQDTAELYDSVGQTFTPISAKMTTPRSGHTATLLQDGKVLLTGGSNNHVELDTAELYDPVTQTFTSISAKMTTPRKVHTATSLPSGMVLLTGGVISESPLTASKSAELYDPSAKTFTPVAATMTIPRSVHTATMLQSGKVLIAGGGSGSTSSFLTKAKTAELFDPATMTFKAFSGKLTTPRAGHAAATLPNGMVLFTGGITNLKKVGAKYKYDALNTVEVY